MFRPGVIFVALLLSSSFVVADTSLYIPDYTDAGDTVSATVIGVGPDGRTTWRIVDYVPPTGTISSAPSPLTATLVQGPSDVIFYASLPDQVGASISCALNLGQANCVLQVDENDTLTITSSFQEPVTSYLVQGGGSPPTSTPAPSGTGTGSTTGKNSGSSLANAVVCVGLLVGGVFSGMVTLFLV